MWKGPHQFFKPSSATIGTPIFALGLDEDFGEAFFACRTDFFGTLAWDFEVLRGLRVFVGGLGGMGLEYCSPCACSTPQSENSNIKKLIKYCFSAPPEFFGWLN
jgi:hypothetical protein